MSSLIRVVLAYTLCFIWLFGIVYLVAFEVSKIRLYVRTRKQGSRIESIPLKRLVKLSGLSRRRWEFKDSWLILEAS